MPQTIKLKRSSTPSQVPTAAQLELGEVAINTADGKMFIKKGDNTIVDVTASGSGGGGGLSDVVDDTTPDLGGDLWLNGKRVFGEGTIMMGGPRTFSSSSKSILCGNDTFDFGDSSALTATNSINTGYNNIITGYKNIAGRIRKTNNKRASTSTAVNGFANGGVLANNATTIQFDAGLDTTYMDSLVSDAGKYGDKDYIPAYLRGYNPTIGYVSECVLVTNATKSQNPTVYTLTVIRGIDFGNDSYAYTKNNLGSYAFDLYDAEVDVTALRNLIIGENNLLGSQDKFNYKTGTYNGLYNNNNTVSNNLIGGRLNHIYGLSWDNLITGREHELKNISTSVIGGAAVKQRSDSDILESCLAVARWDSDFGLPEIGNICQVNLGGANVNFRNAPYSFTFGRGCKTGSTNNSESAAQSTAIGYTTRTWLANGFSGGNNTDCFSDSGMAFGNGSVASKSFSNFAFGQGITTPVSGGAAEGSGQVAVGEYNKYDGGEKEYFSVGTGEGDGDRYTSLAIQERTADSKEDTTGFCGIVMKALAESPVYVSDHYASLGGVPIGGLYRYGTSVNSNRIRIRVA